MNGDIRLSCSERPEIERGTGKTVNAADEADWINLLIASERVSEWLDTIRQGHVEQ